LKEKIGFIGTGNMASAMIKGLVTNYPEINENIYVYDKIISKSEALSSAFKVKGALNTIELVNSCKIIILAVKPNIYKFVLEEIKNHIKASHIIVSIAAGISTDYIQSFFTEPVKVVRTMPNTPALVGEGMTAASPNKQITKEELESVLTIFNSFGKVDLINENLMDVIPAISGSSPAYVYMFIEALADGGVLQGLSRDQAYQYAAQAVLGAAKMVLESGKHPGELKDMVCSPGGTTIEAVYSLEKNHFRGTVIEAMNACTDKAKKLSEK
jgi:pyrroline-5-carboxylate reductase